MSASLELYVSDLSPYAQSIELQLEMKRIAFVRTVPQRDFVRQGEFGAINPIRKIPVLVINGVAVPETQVICELIEDVYPEPTLRPDGALERSRARLLSRIADIYLAGPLVQLFNNLGEKRSEDIASYATGMVERGLISLEHWIAPGPYAVANNRSIADCALPPTLFCAKSVLPGFGLDKLPGLGPKTARYLEAIKKDADVAHCLERMEKALRERLPRPRS